VQNGQKQISDLFDNHLICKDQSTGQLTACSIHKLNQRHLIEIQNKAQQWPTQIETIQYQIPTESTKTYCNSQTNKQNKTKAKRLWLNPNLKCIVQRCVYATIKSAILGGFIVFNLFPGSPCHILESSKNRPILMKYKYQKVSK